jgi:hypothetical protein
MQGANPTNRLIYSSPLIGIPGSQEINILSPFDRYPRESENQILYPLSYTRYRRSLEPISALLMLLDVNLEEVVAKEADNCVIAGWAFSKNRNSPVLVSLLPHSERRGYRPKESKSDAIKFIF